MQYIYGLGKGGDNHIRPAYYSSIGNLESCTAESCSFEEVVITIHGASRNADDYYCSMYSAAQQHGTRNHISKDIVIVALRFAAESDETFALHDGGIPMRWNEGSWRYGQESTSPGSQVSSFQVLDDIIDLLSNSTLFPFLKSVRVIGHSAGGQFVQRWALLTDTWKSQPSLRTIVVNPSSYAYLTPLRKLSTQEWKLPDSTTNCPDYNYWEWGLETNDQSPLYVRNVLGQLPVTKLIERFSTRDVVYLMGDRDVCNVAGMYENGWCYSHGLETLCMDMLEGKNRLERHMTYFESLSRLNITKHRRDLVPGVGHDHSLIFHSEVTKKYLFDEEYVGLKSDGGGIRVPYEKR
jgi:pimeloyl-ACP methyl ester carboxylesterase